MSVPVAKPSVVFMASPQGDEIKEVVATTANLRALMAKGWRQVPAPGPVTKPAAPAGKETN